MIRDSGVFTDKPWMANINYDLLYRLWEKKGCPGVFVYTVYGIEITVIDTIAGKIRTKKPVNLHRL